MSDSNRYWINPADKTVSETPREGYIEVIDYRAFELLRESTIIVHQQLIAFRHTMKAIKQKMLLKDLEDIKEEIKQLATKVIEENPKCKT